MFLFWHKNEFFSTKDCRKCKHILPQGRATQARTSSHFLQPLALFQPIPVEESLHLTVQLRSQAGFGESRLELRTQTVKEEATDERPPTDSALRGRGRMSELELEKLKVEGMEVEKFEGVKVILLYQWFPRRRLLLFLVQGRAKERRS